MLNNVAFANLRAEMSRSGLQIKDVAIVLGVNRDTTGRKLSRKTPLSLDEAFLIKKAFFSDMELQYLFQELLQPDTGQPDRAS